MEKKFYESAEMEIIEFSNDDVVSTSTVEFDDLDDNETVPVAWGLYKD